MKGKNKKQFVTKTLHSCLFGGHVVERFVYAGEVPQFNEGELAEVKKAKGDEKEELKIGELVSAVNAEVNKHAAQLGELPKEYNDTLHNEIKGYLERSTGRYEKDTVKGLSGSEFTSYVAGMVDQVKKFMEDYAPTEEDIKKKKETQEKAKSAKESGEKVIPKEQREKLLSTDPSTITDLTQLGDSFTAYDQANKDMQQDAMKIFPMVGDFQKSYADFEKSRSGIRSYKKFGAYMFPEDDVDRINVQTALDNAKKNVATAKEQFAAKKKTLADYGSKLGEVSNRIKSSKVGEKADNLAKLDEKGKKAEENIKTKKEQYEKMQKLQAGMITQRQKLGTYAQDIEKTKEEQQQKVLLGEDGRQKLTSFKANLDGAIAQIDSALQDPNISPEKKAQLESARKMLQDKTKDAETGINAAGDTIQETQQKVSTLEEGDQKVAVQTLNMQTHLNDQVVPGIKAIDDSIASLEAEKMKYSTDAEEISKYYDESVFKQLDNVDANIDTAILSNNVANSQIEKQLDAAGKTLDQFNMKVPSGLVDAFKVSFSVIGGTIGGALTGIGSGISYLGHAMFEQANWLSKTVDDNRKDMGMVSYGLARFGSEVVNFTIGTGGGLIEMVGGVFTLVGDPVQTVKGLGTLIGRDPNTGEWSRETAANGWKGMGKAIISYDDFEKGHIGLGLGKIFPNVVITIETLGSAQAGKLAAQAAYTAAREAGVGAVEALGRGAVAFGKTMGGELVQSAKSIKNLPGNLKTFVVGAEGEANVFVRAAEMAKKVGGVQLEDVAAGIGRGVKGMGEGMAAKTERLWGGTKFENVRLRQAAGRQAALMDDLASKTEKYEEYRQALKQATDDLMKKTPGMSEEAALRQARLQLTSTNPGLAGEALQYEQNMKKLVAEQQAFDAQATKGMTPENAAKAKKFLEEKNTAQVGMVETSSNFESFAKKVGKGDPEAIKAAAEFQAVLESGDETVIAAWKASELPHFPAEFQKAFAHLEHRLKFSSAMEKVAGAQIVDLLGKKVAGAKTAEDFQKAADDINAQYPNLPKGEQRVLVKLPGEQGSIVLDLDGKVRYLDKTALESHYQSVFSGSHDIPTSLGERVKFKPETLERNGVKIIQEEGKDVYVVGGKKMTREQFLESDAGKKVLAQDTPGWIDTSGKVHFSSDYFEQNFGVKMIQQDGKNMFVYEGKTMSPGEFFRTEKGREVLVEMKAVKNHEVSHRIFEAMDARFNGKLGQDLVKFVEANPELKKLLPAGEELNPRSAQELLSHIADGSFEGKIDPEVISQLEQMIGDGYMKGFNFKRIRRIDTMRLQFTNSNDLVRSAADAFEQVLKGENPVLNNRSFEISYKIIETKHPEIFKMTRDEVLATNNEMYIKAWVYRDAKRRTGQVKLEEGIMERSQEKMAELQSAYNKMKKNQPDYLEKIRKDYLDAKKMGKANEVRNYYPVDQTIFDYLDAHEQFVRAERNIQISKVTERVNYDAIQLRMASMKAEDIEAYIAKLNEELAGAEPPGRTVGLAKLQGEKGEIIMLSDGKVIYRRGKASKAAAESADFDFVGHELDKAERAAAVRARAAEDARIMAEADEGFSQMADEAEKAEKAAQHKASIEAFAEQLPDGPKDLVLQGLIAPEHFPDVVKGLELLGDQMGSELADLFAGNPEMARQIVGMFEKRGNIFTSEQVESLIQGRIDAEKVGMLEANITQPELNANYIEKILKTNPETITAGGKPIMFYEGDAIGKGGVARYFRVAYYEPPSNQLRFTGCKKALQETVAAGRNIDKEAGVARRIIKLKGEGMSTEKLINPVLVADDSSMIFYDVIEGAEPGAVKPKDLSELAMDPNVPPEQLYQYLLDHAETLEEMHRNGLYHFDAKLENVTVGTQGGVTIDLGSVSTEAEFRAAPKVPNRIFTTPTGDEFYVGTIPHGIGVTPHYYSDQIAAGIAQGKLPMWKLDAYALGVQIRELVTGGTTMRRVEWVVETDIPAGTFGAEIEKNLAPGTEKILTDGTKAIRKPDGTLARGTPTPGQSEFILNGDTPVRHEFADPNKTSSMMSLALELMDQTNTTTTVPQAIARMKAILAP